MRILAAAVLVAALLCSASAADAAERHLLRHKLASGEIVRWEIDQRSSVRNTMQGATQEAQTQTVSLKAWKVVDVLPSGEMEFVSLVERVRMRNRLPDRAEMTFNSEKDKEAPPGFEDAARAIGVPLSVVRISPRGEIVDRDVKHRQPAADPYEIITLLLPEGPIEVGESWLQPQELTVKLQDGGTRAIQARRKHTLKSVDGDVATIGTEFQVLSPLTPEVDGQLAHRMVKGTVRFDMAAGRVLSQRLEVDRRVLGFAGPDSSMHLVTRLEERLSDGATDVASRP